MNIEDETPVDLSGLTTVPVPDQWEEILRRAGTDVAADGVGDRVGASPRRPLLAAAAVLVVVLIGVAAWVVAGSDGDGDLSVGKGGAGVEGGGDASEDPTGGDDPSGIGDHDWVLTEVVRDGVALDLPPGRFVLDLSLGRGPGGPGPPGMWTFRACNQGSGSLTLDGDILRSDVWGHEDIGCADVRLHELDRAVGQLLGEGARVQLRGDDLTLTSTNVTARFASHDEEDLPLTDPAYSSLLSHLSGEQAPFVYLATVERTWTEPLEVVGSLAQGRLMAELEITDSWTGGLPEGSRVTLWYGTQLPEGSHPLPDVVSEPLVTGDLMLFLTEQSAVPGDQGIQQPALDGAGMYPIDDRVVVVDGAHHPIEDVRAACTACSGGGG